jgi:hypothetical protein
MTQPPEPITAAEMLHAIVDAVDAGLPLPLQLTMWPADRSATGHPHMTLRAYDDEPSHVDTWRAQIDAPEAKYSDVFDADGEKPWRSYGLGVGAQFRGWRIDVWSAVSTSVVPVDGAE